MADKDQKPPAATVGTAEMRAPEDWAGVCGQRRPRAFESTVSHINGKPFDVIGDFLWQHEVAAVLHGWAAHAHHAGEPMRLTRADYESALKAAAPDKGNPTPHPAALSPHAPKPEDPAQGA
jgi:hypothetical protein